MHYHRRWHALLHRKGEIFPYLGPLTPDVAAHDVSETDPITNHAATVLLPEPTPDEEDPETDDESEGESDSDSPQPSPLDLAIHHMPAILTMASTSQTTTMQTATASAPSTPPATGATPAETLLRLQNAL